MKRKMEGFEESLTLSSEFAPFNIVCVLKIEGRLEAERLRQALAVIQRRHPLLRTCIESREGSHYFDFDKAGPIPLTLAERKTPDDWIVAAEGELNRRVDFGAGPLLQCQYLHYLSDAGGSAEIVLTIHHSIVDARSVLSLLREVLLGCAGEGVDLGGEIVGEGSTAGTTMFPRAYRGAGFARAVLLYMMRQMKDEMFYRMRARGCRKPPIHKAARNKILPIRFPVDLTEALIRATRRERITMNSILTAGLMLAVKRLLYPLKDTPLRNITFTDLRSYLGTPVPESALGCHMGMCRSTVLVKDHHDFWRLAQEVHSAVYRSSRRGETFLANALSPGMMKMIFRMKTIRMGTTALSYAGPIALGDNFGLMRVTGLHAFISNMTIGPEYSALVRLFRGELWWDILYMDSDMEPQKARQIADLIKVILEEAVVITH